MLDGGSALPFAGHKGSSISFMIEIVAGALTGGCFGLEDRSDEYLGAQSSKAEQTVILINPRRVPGNRYFERIESLFAGSRRAAWSGFRPSAVTRAAKGPCATALR